jgi:hypothetical protein
VNGDGRPDLAIASGSPTNGVSLLTNRGGGRFEKSIEFATGRGPLAVAIADLNGDGRPDLAIANRSNTVSILANTPGLCAVQNVRRRILPVATQALTRANCRVGRIRRAYSTVKKGRVISQEPKFGAVLPGGSKVDLLVSRGRSPS